MEAHVGGLIPKSMQFKPRGQFVRLAKRESRSLLILYLAVVLTSEYPAGSFSNIDRSLMPPNTLVVGRGWSLKNQTSLPGYVLDKFPLNFVGFPKIRNYT